MATEDYLIPDLLNLKRTLVDCNSRLEQFQKSKLEEFQKSKLEEFQKNKLEELQKNKLEEFKKNKLEEFQKNSLEELKVNDLGVETQEEVKPSTTFHPENEQQQKIKRIHDRRRAGRRTMRSSGSSLEDESIPEDDDEGRLQMSTVFDTGFEDDASESFNERRKSKGIASENASESNVFEEGFRYGPHASNVSVPWPKHKLKIRGYKPRRYIVRKEIFYPQTNSLTSNRIHFLVICVGVLMLQISFNLLPLIHVQTRAGNIF